MLPTQPTSSLLRALPTVAIQDSTRATPVTLPLALLALPTATHPSSSTRDTLLSTARTLPPTRTPPEDPHHRTVTRSNRTPGIPRSTRAPTRRLLKAIPTPELRLDTLLRARTQAIRPAPLVRDILPRDTRLVPHRPQRPLHLSP
jgi:hypothetical protein